VSDRYALLIGVPRSDDDALFEPIPEEVVGADITAMRDSLEQSNYVVRVLGTRPLRTGRETIVETEASRSRCETEIQRICQAAPPGATLIIYFSGHGIRVDGKDYLVPADYSSADDKKVNRRALIPLDLQGLTEGCRAKLVAVFADACRNPPHHGFEPNIGGSLEWLPDGVFALITGCGANQRCQYDSNGSLFTAALAAAFAPRHRAQTLREVFTAARTALRGKNQDPALVHSAGFGHDELLDEFVICNGDSTLDLWRSAVHDTKLWDRVGGADSGRVEALKAAVVELVCGYAGAVSDQQEPLAATGIHDPWTDRRYPVRVLSRMHTLLGADRADRADRQAGGEGDGDTGRDLAAHEVSTLILGPFLREAVLAGGLVEVSKVDPRDVRPTFQPGHRFDLEMVHLVYGQLCRRVTQMHNDPVNRDAVAMWLVHRWLLGREDLWHRRVVQEWCERASRAVLRADRDNVSGNLVAEHAEVVRMLARSVGNLAPTDPSGDGAPGRRSLDLARLATMAGVLAVDPRLISQVVPEHLGVGDPVSLDELREVVDNLALTRDGDDLALDGACRHPAVHAALSEVAAAAQAARTQAESDGERGGVRAALPRQITDGRVRPVVEDNRRLYQIPLLRFRLATDKVQGLLMGAQLYGDRSVAIRELYQNALDACRYRRLRLRWRYREAPDHLDWPGRIVFRQGVDETGRPFVECEDNGVGMTEEMITGVFAEAGARFVHTDAFRREQAVWQQYDEDLRLYPNSQFGIGVFSYFMLATELSIHTVPTDREGHRTGLQLHVTVAGDGNLFRIRRAPSVPPGIREGGTTVRLVLAGGDSISCADALRAHLLLAEFPVRVYDNDRLVDSWQPNALAVGDPQVAAMPATPDLWWVFGDGCYLTDGIRIGAQQAGSTPGWPVRPEQPFGFVVNMTGPHRPRLSVDRRRIIEWDTGWLAGQLAEAVPALRRWPGTTLHWLWQMARVDPALADEIAGSLGAHEIPIRPHDVPTRRLRVDLVGAVPYDSTLLPDRDQWSRSLLAADVPHWLRPWRHRIWESESRAAGLAVPEGMPERIDGYPVMGAEDAALLSSPTVDLAQLRRLADRRATTEGRLLDRLCRFAIAGLDLRPARTLPDDGDSGGDGDGDGDGAMLREMLADELFRGRGADGPVVLRLVRFAQAHHIAVHDAVRLLDQVAPDLVAGLDLDLASLGEYQPDLIDVRLLDRDLRTDRHRALPAHTGLSLRHLLTATKVLGMPLDELTGRGRRLRALGVWTALGPGAPTPEVLDESDPIGAFILDLAREARPLDLIALAASCRSGVTEVRERALDLAAKAGLAIRLPAMPDSWQGRPDPADVEFLTECQPAEPGLVNRLAAVVTAVRRAGTTRIGTAAAVERVAELEPISCTLDAPMLVAIADAALLSLGEVRRIVLTRLAGPFQLAGAEQIPSTCDSRSPAIDEAWMLLTGDPDAPQWRAPAPLHLAWAVRKRGHRSAAEQVAKLSPYRALGALVPAEAEPLATLVPDDHDLRILSEGLPADRPAIVARSPWEPLVDETVTPLHLVRVAGRFGWDLRRAYDRLARFGPLGLRIPFPAEACPVGGVDWRDVLVLTQYLDGWSPALAGQVPAGHLVDAARRLDEPSGTTYRRLARFAGLFGLDLSGLDLSGLDLSGLDLSAIEEGGDDE
jgi:hypothetical protein